MSYYNKNKYHLKDRLATKLNRRHEEVLDNQPSFTEAEVDKIIENIVNTADPGDWLEPFNKQIVPAGNNSDKTRKLYYRRRYYKEHGFPMPTPSQNVLDDENVYDDTSKYQGESERVYGKFNVVDYMHDKAFYGRIDTRNRSIYPSEKFLRLVNGTKDVMLLSFVCEALNDMLEKIERLKQNGRLGKKSAYFSFKAKKGWESFVMDHHNTIDSVFNAFITKYVNTPEMFGKIRSFDVFSEELFFFLNRFLPKFPLTRTNMQLTKSTNPRISGIVFEIALDPHDDDKKKYKKYILDSHFVMINKLANSYGFMVDKNAPWRFIADLESPQMKFRMAEKGFTTLQGMFDGYYYQTHLYEVDALRNYFLSFYDSFVISYPYYTKVSVCGSGSKAKLLYRQRREKDPFTDEKLLKFYFYLRGKEARKDWNQEAFEDKFREALVVFEHYGFVQALHFINDTTTKIIGKGANFGNKIKKEENYRIIHNHLPSYKRNNFNLIL